VKPLLQLKLQGGLNNKDSATLNIMISFIITYPRENFKMRNLVVQVDCETCKAGVAKLSANAALPENIQGEVEILKAYVCEQVNISDENRLQGLMW
jgi:hypothetical protein